MKKKKEYDLFNFIYYKKSGHKILKGIIINKIKAKEETKYHIGLFTGKKSLMIIKDVSIENIFILKTSDKLLKLSNEIETVVES